MITFPPFQGRPLVAAQTRNLIRWVHRQGLGAGALLPRQPELCRILGSNNNTLGTALSILSRLGFLRRSGRGGTHLVNPDVPVPGLWRLGIVINVDRGFYARMLVEMHRVLSQKFCARASVFVRAAGAEEVGAPRPDQIDGLGEAVAAGGIDGIVSQPSIASEAGQPPLGDIPVEIAGFARGKSSGLLLDQEGAVTRHVRRLADAGARRIAFVRYGSDRSPANRALEAAFLRAVGEAGLRALPEAIFTVPKRGLYSDGCDLFSERILALPKARRPDAFAILNDNVAAYVSLAFRLADYRPLMAVMDNLQIPLPFALPVLPLDVDIDALAARAASKLMERVLNPALPPSIELFHPVEAPIRLPAGYALDRDNLKQKETKP